MLHCENVVSVYKIPAFLSILSYWEIPFLARTNFIRSNGKKQHLYLLKTSRARTFPKFLIVLHINGKNTTDIKMFIPSASTRQGNSMHGIFHAPQGIVSIA